MFRGQGSAWRFEWTGILFIRNKRYSDINLDYVCQQINSMHYSLIISACWYMYIPFSHVSSEFLHNTCHLSARSPIKSFVFGRCGKDIKSMICKPFYRMIASTFPIALRRMLENLINKKLMLDQVMAWCHHPYPEPVVFQWQSSGNPVCLELRPQCTLEYHWRKIVGSQCAYSGFPVVFQWLSSGLPVCSNYTN